MDDVTRLKTGAIISPLKHITHEKGDLYTCLKVSDQTYSGFGEAYFSSVFSGVTKGWKRHSRMTLNLIVPIGVIEFYLVSDYGAIRDALKLGSVCYARLTVPPGIWLAFRGIGPETNLLLNLANIPHDPNESDSRSIDYFPLP